MIYLLTGLFIALQLADIFLTKKILDAGGSEKMKIARTVMEKLGVLPGLILMKAVAIALVVYVSAIYHGALWYLVLCVFIALYIKVAIHNYRQLNHK